MNRIEFMTELAALLQDVPEEERRDAMQFYNDYFDDAGTDKEGEVISELESPAKVAEKIKADLLGQQGNLLRTVTRRGASTLQKRFRLPEKGRRQGRIPEMKGTDAVGMKAATDMLMRAVPRAIRRTAMTRIRRRKSPGAAMC